MSDQVRLTPRQWFKAPRTFGHWASATLSIPRNGDGAPAGQLSDLLAAVSQHMLCLRANAHIAHLTDKTDTWLGKHTRRLGAPGTVKNQLHGHKPLQWDVACNLAALLGPDVWPHPESLRLALDRAALEYQKVAGRAKRPGGQQ